jgi:spermidine synthase/MFS family permease
MVKALMNYRRIYFLLFALSGFSGLIYESIWTHYLKLFLGHAAYSQTLVLAIFMGGMAIGSWICSRYSSLWKNLLLGYALTEGIIGLLALIFHNAFVSTVEFSYTSILPQLGNPAIVSAFKWTLSALMILPQSVLLGMTFPLMSAGILRLFPDRPGRSVAMLYFTNSIGAAIGVLVSGFMLIRLTGLPGTIRIAGIINIVLALTVWFLTRKSKPEGEHVEVKQETAYRESNNRGYWFFLLVSLVTGTSSFIYEIGWIRMLSLVLGSSTHAFELMLSAFIFGLAFGGLWIQRRIDQVMSPVRYLAQVQLIMGLLALSTLLLYGNTFEVMQWIIKSLSKTDTGYALFNLSSSGLAWVIMLPTTFCAGMTLPLITFTLLRKGYGERSIGAVYAANTVGAIVAVFFAIHFGMPILGLKGLITAGAGLDIALAIALFWNRRTEGGTYRQPAVATAIGLCAIIGILLFVKLDPYKMASGVYRQGTLSTPEGHRLLYHKDGKTATVSCFLNTSGLLSIRTNGKPDAAMMTTRGMEAASDEYTMTLLGVIPMTLHPHAKTAASIGLGSGMTSHILLCNPLLRRLDTVEIEKGMVEAANNFRPRVELVYTDPRSKIYIDDAKTFFSTYNKRYDLIVSEPSNPWVSGVATLFSEEFYRLITHHLNDDGLFVQWMQLYEIDVDLVVSVLKAISTSFSDFAIYAANRGDIMIIAKKRGPLSEPDYSILKVPIIAATLKRIHVEKEQDIAIRKIGTKKFLETFLETFPIRTNSDYYPVLDQNAARTRFMGSSAFNFLNFAHVPVPTLEMLDGSPLQKEATNLTPTPDFEKAQETITAMGLRDYFLAGDFNSRYVQEDLKQKAVLLKHACGGTASLNESDRLGIVFNLSVAMTSYLIPAELEPFWKMLESGRCAATLSVLERQWYNLFKAVGKRDAAHMLEESRALLSNMSHVTPLARKYLLASGMLGALAQGDRRESHRLWSENKDITFGNDEPDLLFRLLSAESRER